MAEMTRGANVALTREVPGLRTAVLGISWDAGSERVLDDNLVFAVLLVGADGKVRDDRDVVFFNQLTAAEGPVVELGDDGEQVEVELAAVPAEIERVVAVLYVNDGPAQRRTLGQLRSCVVRVLNGADGAELVRSEQLATAFAAETAVALGELYRHDGGWKFKVLGQGYAQGIRAIASDYGVPL
jgi:tellurium resistance protein TerD